MLGIGAVAAILSLSQLAHAADTTLRNEKEFVLVHPSDGSYEIGQGNRRLLLKMVRNVMMLPLNLVRRPRNHGKQIVACCRGLWHGVTGNIAARY